MSRRRFFRVHQAVGLAIATFALVTAVSGGILVFRDRLRPAVPRAEAVETPLLLERIVERAVAEGDGSPATDIELPLRADAPYIVWLDDDAETEVYLDGHGRVLAVRRGAEGFTRVLFRLHTGELLGPGGTIVAFGTAAGLCVLALSGLAMVWSRRRSARAITRRDDPKG